MRHRTLLVSVALVGTVFTVTSCAQKRQATEVQRPTATATGTSAGKGADYGGPQGKQSPDSDNGILTSPGPQTPASPASPVTPAPGSGPINNPGTNNFPDPTPPANPNNPPNNPPPTNFTGDLDDIPTTVGWALTNLDPGTKVAADGTVTGPGTTGTVPPTTNTATTVGYDGRVAAIITNNCVGNCHVDGGTQSGTAMATFADAARLGSGIVARASLRDNQRMPPPPANALGQPDIDLLKAWETSKFPQTSGAGGAGVAAGGGANPNENCVKNGTLQPPGKGIPLVITGERYEGKYINATKVTGKVGQTLTLVNNSQAAFTIHTAGAPFGHGSEVAAGQTQDYCLESVHQGEGDIYEHTNNGSNNPDRLIRLEVTQ